MSLLRPIWLVEDSDEDVELTLAALQEIHLANRVVVMRDGSEVLDRLQIPIEAGCQPAVILLDIKMPKVSGIEVLRHIKGDPDLKHLPVVMLTSSRQGPDVTECYNLGANAYVVKPVDFTGFFDAVRTAGKFWAVVNERLEPGSLAEGYDVNHPAKRI
jgi:CheY-like chemotaxis protein